MPPHRGRRAPIGPGDRFVADLVQQVDTPKVLVVSKTDLVTDAAVGEQLVAAVAELGDFDAYVPLSSLTGEGVDALLGELESRLPEGPEYYPGGVVTDQPETFLVAELVREKLLRVAREELPHSITVVAEELDEPERDDDVLRYEVKVLVERESQKGMVIGKGGAVIREAGTAGPRGARGAVRCARAPRDQGEGRPRLATPRRTRSTVWVSDFLPPSLAPLTPALGFARAARGGHDAAMHALLFGVAPRNGDITTDNPLLAALERTPMDYVEMPDPGFMRPDWVITAPRLTGICGSDAKQVFMDWGEGGGDNPMREFSSMPQVLGHEVVTEVVALGPEAEGVEIGDRVVLNPWLSCVPRGVSPICPACEVGDLSLCWNFQAPPLAPGIHIGTSSDVPGGWANLMPAHPSMLFPVPDSIPDEVAVFADPFAVSLHAVTRHAPPPGGKVLVYGAGALGTCAIAILRARCIPTSRSASSRASVRRPISPASSARTRCSRTSPRRR